VATEILLAGWCPEERKEGRMASSAMLRRVALVRTDVSEELSASIIRGTRIDDLGKTLAVIGNPNTLIFSQNAWIASYC
jgi:hypothetical protein